MFAPTATVARQRSGCGSRWRWCVRYVPLWGRISYPVPVFAVEAGRLHRDAGRQSRGTGRLAGALGGCGCGRLSSVHPPALRARVPGAGGADGELSLAGWTKRITGLPAIAVGSVGLQTEFKPSEVGDIEPAPVEAVLRQFADNEFDVIAVGRALLSDPEWVNKLRSGRQGEFVGFNIGKALSALY